MYFDRFTVGTLNRVSAPTVRTAGSKGLNAARALKTLLSDVLSVSFSGGAGGDFLESETAREAIPSLFIRTACGVRENVKMIDNNGVGTEANERGGPISPAEIAEMEKVLLSYAGPDTVYLLCGSIPPGVDVSEYAALTEKLKALGAAVAVDCDGEALRAALCAHPDLIKPNKRELEGFLGKTLNSVRETAAACREIAEKYSTDVLCTLGEDGSLCAEKNGKTVFASAPSGVTVRGFAGAGDTYLGVYCHHRYGLGESVEKSMTAAASASAAKVECEGSKLPDIDGICKYVSDIEIEIM